VSNISSVPAVVAASDLIGAVPERIAREWARSRALRILPMPIAVPDLSLTLVWHESRQRDPAQVWLRALVTREVSALDDRLRRPRARGRIRAPSRSRAGRARAGLAAHPRALTIRDSIVEDEPMIQKKKAVRKPAKKTARRSAPPARHARKPEGDATREIDRRIEDLGDWRGETLALVRRLIHEADPEIAEEWKWVKASSPGTPVWSHQGMICTGEAYRSVVKLTFAKGAALRDPSRLFNSSLEGNVRRAIDIHEDDEIDEAAFKNLIRAAVALNLKSSPRRFQG
jgi:hypothetical protein